jgi:hypothetical protein
MVIPSPDLPAWVIAGGILLAFAVIVAISRPRYDANNPPPLIQVTAHCRERQLQEGIPDEAVERICRMAEKRVLGYGPKRHRIGVYATLSDGRAVRVAGNVQWGTLHTVFVDEWTDPEAPVRRYQAR